jgi:hypothetical protein
LRFTLDADVGDGATGGDFMAAMARGHGAIAERVFDAEAGEFRPNVLVVFNERVSTAKDVCQARLKDGDRLAVFPLDSGG